jgi:predicted signal transduction protein with EAL and GGDEF domain
MSGCGAEEAELKRDELQRAIDAVFFEARPGKRVRIGVSIGTAVFPHDGDSYEVLLATADSRMYQNKADRKRRAREEDARRATLAAAPPADRDAQRSASGII